MRPHHMQASNAQQTVQPPQLNVKAKGATPQLGGRRGTHLPLAAVEPVGG